MRIISDDIWVFPKKITMKNYHPLYFRFLRGLQLVMSIICLTLQIISFLVWFSYVQSNDLSDGIGSFFRKNDKLYPIKIYYLIIIFLTIIGTGFYIISFSKLSSNIINTSMDIFYFALWFSSGNILIKEIEKVNSNIYVDILTYIIYVIGLANLNPIYNGSSDCKQYVDHDYDLYGLYDNYQPPWIGTACRTFIAGLAFAFLNASLFLITLFLSLRLHKDHSESPYHDHESMAGGEPNTIVVDVPNTADEPNTEVVNRNKNSRWI
ncbi:hypothetical protein Glove_140g123 [Diversispora epigaea]|uniref:MARVEL domain-containing protein n=1 Tax=Diversispora epigaea TaxID=1348612 RepID=A0A397IV03_9GLOM|nr:hypothetical protein Glove_140g123 [Diversispora epigaea]